jgi:chemotaxis protein CheD
MKIESYKHGARVIIEPGEFYSTSRICVISTLLGSCVAACLYDPVNRLIGMNHFMLSNTRYSHDKPIHVSEAGRYGIHAMELLINDMMSKGAKRQYIRAKIFGGATVLFNESQEHSLLRIGNANCEFIRDFMNNENIPVESEDLGGSYGRVIHFSNGDFTVHRRKIKTGLNAKIATRDRDCWQRAIDNQRDTQSSVDLW